MASASFYCPRCGTPNEPHSTFCSNCGSALQKAGPATPYPPDGPTSRSSSFPTYPASNTQLPPYRSSSSSSSPTHPASGAQLPPYRSSDSPSSATYPASGAQQQPSYQINSMPSSPSYPADGPRLPPANPNGGKLPSPSPKKPRRGKKIGIIAIIATTMAILLVGAYLAVALLKPASPIASKSSPTATPIPTATQPGATPTTAPTATPTSQPAASPTVQNTPTAVTQSGLPCTVDVGTWSDGSSDWKNLNGTLLNDGTGNNGPSDNGPSIVAPCQPTSTANYVVETKIQVVSGSGCFGISVRGNPSNNGWQGYLAGVGGCYGGTLDEAYLAGPTYTEDSAGVQASFSPGTDTHTYRVEVNNNTIKLYVDNSLLLTLTDNRYLTGAQVGLWDQGVQLQVTSFSVTAAS